MKYRFGGKEKLLSFGAYPAVSLAEARLRRAKAKVVLGEGGVYSRCFSSSSLFF